MLGATKMPLSLAIKVVCIGDGYVGKTTLIKAYLRGEALIDRSYKQTIGAEIFMKESKYVIEPYGEVAIKWLIWDLAGQPTYRDVRAPYYKGAHAAIAVFDVSRPSTLKNLRYWIAEFFKNVGSIRPLILVGNKIDLRKQQRCLPPEAGMNYAKILSEQLKIHVEYVETSAINNINVEQAFKNLAKNLIDFYVKRKAQV